MKVILVLLLLGLARCFAGDFVGPLPDAGAQSSSLAATDVNVPSPYSRYAVIQRSCAPWDGSAIELRLSPSPIAADRTSAPSISISIWKSREAVSGGTFRFPDDTGRIGTASHCRAPDNCELIESGTVRFDPFEDGKPATGAFDIVLRGGHHEQGSFKAIWSSERVLCG